MTGTRYKNNCISAVVHIYGHERHLAESLNSMRWCDEIVVIDLGAAHSTRRVPEHFADRILLHDWVPIPDGIRSWNADQARYDWILMVDPDEILSYELGKKLRYILALE